MKKSTDLLRFFILPILECVVDVLEYTLEGVFVCYVQGEELDHIMMLYLPES